MSTEIVREEKVVLGEKLDPAEQSNTSASLRAGMDARIAQIQSATFPTPQRRAFERALRAYSHAAYELLTAWEEMESKKNASATADVEEATKYYPPSINCAFDDHAHAVGAWYLRMIGEVP